jgi:hypothetical protein
LIATVNEPREASRGGVVIKQVTQTRMFQHGRMFSTTEKSNDDQIC